MQASFAWDWGPALPSVGIWKLVYFEAYSRSTIRYVTVQTEDEDHLWKVTVNVAMSAPPSLDAVSGSISIEIKTDKSTRRKSSTVQIYYDKKHGYWFTKSLHIPKSEVGLWWPNGYGNASLYPIVVNYSNRNGDNSTKSVKIGFRTVRLVEDKVKHGRTFYFVVNEVPIFAKGSNSIPINVLPEKGQDPETIRFLLQSAKDVHMNMIRVWGGGVYESDLFYELADEMGIMIWQDFMFTCAMYPTNKDFLRTVKEEVRHQVRRLQYHPSIVLWAGNNENEAALRQNWYGTVTNYSLYHKDYITLYIDTIKAELLDNDKSRRFLTSSPTNGIESDKSHYIAFNPQDDYYGDVHFYNYASDPWIQGEFPIPRFSSEYGMQSLPSLTSWLTVTNNLSDLVSESSFMEHRQHHPDGTLQIRGLISHHIDLPNDNSNAFYKAFIFYSQIIQAMAIKQQTEFYRLWRGHTNSKGRGLTMGALYWQLNDVWVAPTWSGIDFNKNWKMLHYFARNFFSPVIVASHLLTHKKLDVYVVSDLMTNSSNNSLNISVYNWKSMTPLYQETINVHVLSGSSRLVYNTEIDKYIRESGCDETQCFLYFSLTDVNNDKIAPDNFVFPDSLKYSNIPSASVTVTDVKQLDAHEKEFRVTVKASGIALFVWLETGHIRGTFSDNGFLQVTETKSVKFLSASRTTATKLRDAITVTHLKAPEYLEKH